MESPDRIRIICQAGKDGDPGWYRIHRGISIYLTWLSLHTRLMPNHISLLMIVVGTAGAALLSFVQFSFNLLGFCLLYMAFLLDKVDGELARYGRMESVRGILLDRLHHRLVEPSIFLAVAYREYQMTSSVGVLVAGLVTMLLANSIEEHQNLSPRIFVKYLKQVGTLPEVRIQTPSPSLIRAITLLKPLKGLRMFIVVLPLLAIVYGVEWMTDRPVTKYYLYTSLAALFIYLVFQVYYYFVFKLDEEIASIAEYFPGSGAGAHGPEEGGTIRTLSAEGTGVRRSSHPARRKLGGNRGRGLPVVAEGEGS